MVINIKLTWELFYILWYQISQIRCVFNIHKTFPSGLATFQLLNSHVSGLGPEPGWLPRCPAPVLMCLGSLWLAGQGGD